jgi:hypothetical protein
MRNKLVLLLAAILVVSLKGYSNTIESTFLKETILSIALQQTILDQLNLECAEGISEYGLSEVSSVVLSKKSELGTKDTIYRTEFSSQYYFDGMHPSHQRLIVDSFEREASILGTSKLKVLKIQGNCTKN